MKIQVLNLEDKTIGNYTFKQFDILIELGLGGTIPNKGQELSGDILLRDNQLKLRKDGGQYIVAKQFKLNGFDGNTFYMSGTMLSDAIQQKVLEIINEPIAPHTNNVKPTPEAEALLNEVSVETPKQEEVQEEINLDDIKF